MPEKKTGKVVGAGMPWVRAWSGLQAQVGAVGAGMVSMSTGMVGRGTDPTGDCMGVISKRGNGHAWHSGAVALRAVCKGWQVVVGGIGTVCWMGWKLAL